MPQPIGPLLDDPAEFVATHAQGLAANAVFLAIAQLRLLDHLDEGPISAANIAERAGLQAEGVSRVLRFLVSHQILDCDPAGRLAHTSRSRVLQRFQLGLLPFLREDFGAAQGLTQSLKTGLPAFDCHFGKPVFQYLLERPDAVEYFGALMAQSTASFEAFLFANHSFAPFTLAVDVGGNRGNLLVKILGEYPAARGILFDLPGIARIAAPILAESPVAERIEAVGGDFFEGLPAGGDLYLLKHILHDWKDDECVRILRSVRSAIADGGRLAVMEFVLPEQDIHHRGFALDIQMLVHTGGRERRLSEFELLLTGAGFRLDRVTENPHGHSILEAVPV